MSNKENTQEDSPLDDKLIKLGFLRQLINEMRLTDKTAHKHGADISSSSWNTSH